MHELPLRPVSRFEMPAWLHGAVESAAYARWLQRKAVAHVRRDRARGRSCSVSDYKFAIHQAVVDSNGLDAYTGEMLDWHLLSRYRNEESREGRHVYRREFALLPSVDHEIASEASSRFRICAWRTNDAKNDLSPAAFIALCQRVLTHAGWQVVPPPERAPC